ncbi:hypothetical protein BKA70DRAFT_1230075 [Coprinopsis sp. MPI-PUGE-AT-0042]|nr:hypothetical protein BKA70DRAFT_1230075 [Coprinopsis sp. MPI-PUGE-AT-0042]
MMNAHSRNSTLPAPYQGLRSQGRAMDRGIQPPFQRVPPETWFIFFGLVLPLKPFGRQERRAYLNPLSVCTSWRREVATRGIFTDFDILLDDWVGASMLWAEVKKKVAAWLPIIHPVRPYYLCIGSNDVSSLKRGHTLIRLLLTSRPSPTNVSIAGDSIVAAVLASTFSQSSPTHLEVTMDETVDDENNIRFSHEFQNFLKGPPSLRELKIDTTNEDYSNFGVTEVKSIELPSIEVLAVIREDLSMEVLSYLTLPSSIPEILEAPSYWLGRGRELCHWRLHRLFSRSRFSGGTISITGTPLPRLSSLLSLGALLLPPSSIAIQSNLS